MSIRKPRERLIKDGPDILKNHELIAVILGKGSRKEGVLSIARRIMDDYGTKSLSGEKDVKRLTETLNLTEIQACQIIAALELGRRLFGKARKETFLNSPGDVFSYLTNIGKLEKEVMHGLYLDVKNKLLRDEVISVGTVSCSLVHPREVYIAENKFGEVDTVHRKFTMTARAAFQMFGDAVSDLIKRAGMIIRRD